MFSNFQSAARALGLWCARRGVLPAHQVGGIGHNGPDNPQHFVDVMRELRKGPMARPRDPSGAVTRHDETTEELLAFADILEQVLIEEAEKGAAQ